MRHLIAPPSMVGLSYCLNTRKATEGDRFSIMLSRSLGNVSFKDTRGCAASEVHAEVEISFSLVFALLRWLNYIVSYILPLINQYTVSSCGSNVPSSNSSMDTSQSACSLYGSTLPNLFFHS